MSHSQRVPSEVNRSVRNLRTQIRPQDGRLFLRDEDLEAGLSLILSAEQRLNRAIRPLIDEAGFSRIDFDILISLHATPGLTVQEVRKQLTMTVPTFARLMGQLDQKGLIKKGRSVKDARARTLQLSEKGEALLGPIIVQLRDIMRVAYREAGAENVSGARAVLQAVITSEDKRGA